MNLRKIANVLFLALTLALNFFAVTLPLNGKTPRELSDQFPNHFTPAPVTFSIWSVIYLGIIAFALWQFVPLGRERALRRDAAIKRLGWRFVLVSLLNLSWLICWHYEMVALSVMVMLTLLGFLIRINFDLFEGAAARSADERWFLQIPFGIYLGWISVATVANITAFLVHIGWRGWGISEPVWAIAVIIVAITLALAVLRRWHNYPYALAVSWALYGIYLKQSSPLELFHSDAVQWVAMGGSVLLLIVSGISIVQKIMASRLRTT